MCLNLIPITYPRSDAPHGQLEKFQVPEAGYRLPRSSITQLPITPPPLSTHSWAALGAGASAGTLPGRVSNTPPQTATAKVKASGRVSVPLSGPGAGAGSGAGAAAATNSRTQHKKRKIDVNNEKNETGNEGLTTETRPLKRARADKNESNDKTKE